MNAEYQQNPLKVMSYNMRIASPPSLNWNGTDLAAIARVINTHKPDLVALQEVDAYTARSGKNSHQAKELARLTGMNYFFAKAVDRSEGDYGVAVLSRFPITESYGYRLPVSPGSEGEVRGAAVIIASTPQSPIVFVSAHFDHLSDEDRRLQAEKLLEILEPYAEYPIIVGADLNMEPNDKVMDVIREKLVGCLRCPLTFPQDNPQRTYDYILQNKRAARKFSLTKYYAIEEDYASDHLPLVAVFMLKN